MSPSLQSSQAPPLPLVCAHITTTPDTHYHLISYNYILRGQRHTCDEPWSNILVLDVFASAWRHRPEINSGHERGNKSSLNTTAASRSLPCLQQLLAGLLGCLRSVQLTASRYITALSVLCAHLQLQPGLYSKAFRFLAP